MKRMKWMLTMPLVALAVLGCSATQPLQSGAAQSQAAALNTQELHFVDDHAQDTGQFRDGRDDR